MKKPFNKYLHRKNKSAAALCFCFTVRLALSIWESSSYVGRSSRKKDIKIALPKVIEAGVVNRLLRELGATLHYDVYSFEARDSEVWQSRSLLYIELRMNEVEVDAQEDFNQIVVSFPLATRPSSDQSQALELVEKLIKKFNGNATYQGSHFSKESVQKDWDTCNDFLLKEWGEEPGSESLRRMIEENYA